MKILAFAITALVCFSCEFAFAETKYVCFSENQTTSYNGEASDLESAKATALDVCQKRSAHSAACVHDFCAKIGGPRLGTSPVVPFVDSSALTKARIVGPSSFYCKNHRGVSACADCGKYSQQIEIRRCLREHNIATEVLGESIELCGADHHICGK